VLLHYLAKPETRKLHLLTHSISALPEFNQLLLDFFNLFVSRLMFRLLYDSINLVINPFSLGLLGARFRRKEVESAAPAGLLHTQSTNALSAWFPVSQGSAEPLDR